jgi:hypothetical protein
VCVYEVCVCVWVLGCVGWLGYVCVCTIYTPISFSPWPLPPLSCPPLEKYSCITIIDTIILHIHTYTAYDAYTYDTYLGLCLLDHALADAVFHAVAGKCVCVCV